MENAGRSAALALGKLVSDGPVVILAGPGNNGGDGLVLARTLAAEGREVEVAVLGDRPRPDPLFHGWPVESIPVPSDDVALQSLLAGGACVVDALLGTGVRGAPRPEYERVIRAVNGAGRPVFALDIPSGVDAGSGAVTGQAVRADVTVAFGSPKLGCLLFPGRDHVGRLVAVEIGFPPPAAGWASARLITPDWVRTRRPRRALPTHKKAEGWLVILAGSPGMAGTAVLAARGALRAGAGYVQVASSPENRSVIQAAVPEAIFIDASDESALLGAVASCDAVAAGPGMGTGELEAELLDRVLAVPGPSGFLLDADALTLAGSGSLSAFPGSIPAAGRLLTPHPGELSRLGETAEAIRSAPLGACRSAAERWAAVVLLKGAPSVVSGPPGSGPVRVSATASSNLARAGMGDVLTGVAGAFMARGLTAIDAAAVALHYTGRAAAATGRGETMIPSDVPDALGWAMAEARDRSSDLGLPFVTLDLDPPW
jgi:NAD(P)H-hydrate epimerase